MAAAALDARAFAAEVAFVHPEEAREVARSLLRAEFAAREAERLGLAADAVRAAAELAAFEEGLRAELGRDADLDAWARARYGTGWAAARAVLGEHLARNQLFQLCVRAEALSQARVRMFWLVTADGEEARDWARRLAGGLDPRTLMPASRLAGDQPDGSFAPIPARLPPPHEDALAAAAPGDVVGPFQFEGDRLWWVGRVAETVPPQPAALPASRLLADLEARPLQPLEVRAWFEEMLRRYTATAAPLPIAAPSPAFVPAR